MEQAVIAFFSACRRLGNQGRTIFVTIHAYAFGSEMFTRLRSLCDGYITLGSEQVRGKSVRTLEINKIGTVEQNRDNMVSFVVEPEAGMRLIPFNRTKALKRNPAYDRARGGLGQVPAARDGAGGIFRPGWSRQEAVVT